MEIHRGKGQSFARRIYLPRMIGVGVGCFSIIAALAPLPMPSWIWALLAFNAVIWPHVAYRIARHAHYPYRAERRNILIDSLMGGFWAATIQFNPLVTVNMLALMTMHNVAAGGPRLMLRGLLAQLLGILVSWLIFTPAFNGVTTQIQIYACLPVLILYPVVIGMGSFQVAIKLADHKRALSALSRTDSLTGLLNHGSWKDLLQIKFHKCRQTHCQAAIALIDIDHFKTINDSYGHLIGDSVLRQLSRDLKANLREHDLAGRYGGDEFCVILPGLSLEQASEIMERLRQVFSNLRSEEIPELRVTLSIGLAPFRASFKDAGAWLNEADKALYIAKNTGRNKVNSTDGENTESSDEYLASSA
ncbi:diguanylate cyclase [Pseudomonas asplenii]|uniref:diguanylate cyclase n=1 Tax=Pseudomonas asplenii TaxID=53407 RepID=UPI0006B4A0C3|nr:diguanylate cyclase [Pseudomonas fuscovaginae]KPA98019.1 diguanylate cyclase (GGDEF) domain-containing protein [Pseudomonas fuscovaginae]